MPAASKRGNGKVTFASKQFKLQRVKAKATITPVASPGQLKGIWAREFGVYRVRIVKVLKRRGSLLTFSLQGNPRGFDAEGPFTVDLDDGVVVWGELPSTAQLVDPGSSRRIGYLLLNENWLRENVVPEAGTESGRRQVALLSGGGSGGGGGGGEGPKMPPLDSL